MRPEELPQVTGDSPVLGALRSGQLVAGRFRLDRFLGKGGMGVVWSARDEVLRKERALKFLCDELAHDAGAKADLADEVARCQELTHANILRVHDFVEDKANSLVAVSMELVTGGTMSARRVTEPHRWIEPEQLLPWVEQLCAALTYAHEEAGIVHRDLKPSNLLLDSRDRLKLADFGISQALTAAMTRATRRSIAFSLPYASPEQLLGQHPTAAQDLYSLGATLFEMLTGKPPFYQGDISHQTMHRVPDSIASRRLQLENVQSSVPEVWEEVIADLLKKNPANRPASAREVMSRLTSHRSHPNAIAGGGNFGAVTPEQPVPTSPTSPTLPAPQVRRPGSMPVAKDPVLASFSKPAQATTLPLLDARRKRPLDHERPADIALAKSAEMPPPVEAERRARLPRQRLVVGASVALVALAATWGGQKLLRPAKPRAADHRVATHTPPPGTPAAKSTADLLKHSEERIALAATPVPVSIPAPTPTPTPVPTPMPAPVATPPPALASVPMAEPIAEPAATAPLVPMKPAESSAPVPVAAASVGAASQEEKPPAASPSAPVLENSLPPKEEVVKQPAIRLLIGKSVAKLKSGGFKLLQCSYIDEQGKNETTLQADEASEWTGGIGRMKSEGKWRLVNAEGIWVGEKWDEMRDFAGDRAAVSSGGKWGFIDRQGGVVIPPQWEEAGPFSQGRARVRAGRARSYIDEAGKALSSNSWDEAWRFFEDRGAVMSNGKWGFVDLTGQLVIPAVWDEVNVFSEGLARVRKGKKWGYIDASGKAVVPPQWDGALDFSEGLARVRRGSQMGFIDQLGKVVIALRFQDAGSFSSGLVDARLNGKCGYLKASGEWAIAPQWKANRVFVRGLAPVSQNGGWGVIGLQGEKRVETEWDDVTVVEPFNAGPVFIRGIRKATPASGYVAYFDEQGSEFWRGEVSVASGEL